jgi:trimeric autotransporter adhesin
MRVSVPLIRVAIASLALSAMGLFGQSFQGGVRGNVADAGGAMIAEAKITLIDESTNSTRVTLSNATGEYSFTAVNPSTYTLQVEAPGFKRFEKKSIIVGTQQFLTMDARLEVGDVTESIMVTEEVPLIESANASTGQVIDRQKLIDLPNLGRNPFMMSKIAQNVTPVGNPNFNRMQDQSGSSQISIAGGPVRGNNYLLDGVPITDTQNRAVIIPTIESVQEVKVQANTYDAEMGRTGGGVFNTYLKSGSNRLTGSGFGYIRETDWIANTYFNNRDGVARRDQPARNYGGSLGGPIWIPKVYDGRNKSFFFLGGEAYRMTSSVSNRFALPTQAEINGDFSQSRNAAGTGLQLIYDPATTRSNGAGGFIRDPFPGNIIPASRINPTGLALAKLYPTGGSSPTSHGSNNFTAATSQYDRADQLTGKFDHQVFDWWRASLSYLHYGSQEPGENWFGNLYGPSQWLLARKVDSTQLNNIFTVTPTTVVSVRYGFNRFPNDNFQRSLGFDPSALGFQGFPVGGRSTLPFVDMETFADFGVNNNQIDVFASKNFMVGVSKFIGRHNLKAGYDFRRLSITGITYGNGSGGFVVNDTFTRANPAARTAGTGSDLASLLLGAPASVTADVGSKLHQFVNYHAFYVHDDFRLNPKLTLNLGIRYEYESGLRARDNALLVGFDPNVASPLGNGLKGGVLYAGVDGNPTQTGNLPVAKWAPRIGVAYAMNSKTTLRGGYGIFYAPIAYSLQTPIGYTQNNSIVSSFNNTVPTIALNNPYPNGKAGVVGNSLGLRAGVGQSVTFIDQTHGAPIVHQYSFDIQREIGWGTTLLAGYVGSTGRNLVMGAGSVNINQLPTEFLSRGAALNGSVPNPAAQPNGTGFLGATTTLSRALRPFPQFDAVNRNFSDDIRSRYDSFVVKAQKRATNGLSLVATWTWSKMFDNAFGGPGNNLGTNGGIQNNYDLDAEYALSVLHTPHRLSSGFTYELPFGKGKQFMNSNTILDLVAGGWSINGVSIIQTGFPLAIRQQANNNSVIGATNQRPNATGISPEVSGSFAQRLDGWVNPAAFQDAPVFTFGNVGRHIDMRGPGQVNWDISVFKTFSVFESFKAQFRAEALNAMNTPLFRVPETRTGNANFGKVTSQANFPRMIQLGVRFFF